MARPTKYNEEKAAQIATLLRSGCTRKDAVGSIGIDYTTFLRWIEHNPSFANLVTSAEAFAAVKMTTILTKAADGDWRAALEWLKRRKRDEWGDTINVGLDTEITRLMATLAGAGKAETEG